MNDPNAGKGELIAKADVPVEVGFPTERQERKWISQQVPYVNFAGKNEDLDARAVSLVRSHVNAYRERMSGPMQRWALNWRVANGDVPWQFNDDDVHIFESQKAVNGMAARVEEAILQFDPPLEIESHQSDISRREAKVLASWTHRQMEQAEWQELIQPTARSGLLTNYLVLKVSYDRRKELIVDRSTELVSKSGKPYWRDVRRMREAVVRRGVRYDQVDPFWFFHDLEAKNAQECSFIGDESEPMLHDLEMQASLGLYSKSQLAKIKTNRLTGEHVSMNGEWVDSHRHWRSVALGSQHTDHESSQNDGGQRVRMIEAYEHFDFGDGFAGAVDPLGRPLRGVKRVLITIVDGIVVRFQLNPSDRKLVPYALSRVNNNGASAVAPAPWDAVTQMNMHLDRFGSNVFRWIDLLVSPIVVHQDPNSEFGKSLAEVKAGTVIRNAGPWNFLKAPDITQSVEHLLGIFRREMEETSGALRVFEGPQGTATETERKVQEQQRAARAAFRAASDLWEQVALLTQSTLAQFSRAPERFAAVGKAASAIGSYVTITPDLMMRDVRFRMIGMKNLHVLGTRAQGMTQWSTRWASLLPTLPNVNVQALAKLDFELSVGRAGSDQVFGTPESPWEIWSQAEENAILLSGQQVDVHPMDDDEEHARQILPLLRRQDLPDYITDLLAEHLNMHLRSAEQKRAQEAAAQRQAENSARLLGPTGGQPGQDRPPSSGGMPAQKDRGITPGPEQDRTAPRSGRKGNMSQTQAM